MARITCRQASTGKPLNIRAENVGVSWITLAEAPDFSLPDPSGNRFPGVRDPLDASRGIAPGEVFFLTPLTAKNKDTVTRWIEVRFVSEGGANNDAVGRIVVPAGETVQIPVQGRSLIKRNAAGANGDRLQVRAQAANTFDVWAAGNERTSDEHVGVVT